MAVKDSSTNFNESNGTKILVAEGFLTSFKELYQASVDKDEKITWTDKEPKGVSEAAENEETAQHAIITRLQRTSDSRKKFELHSIIVQSPWLRSALAEILEDYPGVHCGLKRLEFEAPFSPFVHRWSRLLEYRARTDLDETTTEHIELLYDILRVELKDLITTLEDYVDHGIVNYEHLWTIFSPGSTIYSDSHNGARGVYKLETGTYIETRCGKAYRLELEAIDFDGDEFGRLTQHISIREFIGTTRILGLPAFPLSFHSSREKIEEMLVGRGKRFEDLAGCHYKEYNGFAVGWDRDGNEIPIDCSGRIIIDAGTFSRYCSYHTPYLDALAAQEGTSESECASNKSNIEDFNTDNYIFGKQAETKRVRLTEQHHLMCSSRARGYSLKKKEWLLFYVDLIKDIKFDDDAFDSLVLPADQKELILSFAESQSTNSIAFDDVIAGKGRGHITLLSGPPGVGKTLTAESVAEHMHTPLFMMSASDLGSSPGQVENKLTHLLDMVAKWNAILLLDECDVFLEARATHDLERNKLVSIFLRVLEYYQGLLFLTTNRVDNIDAAFQSRIHVSLVYPDLTAESRRCIWENFVRGLGVRQDWSEEDLDELAMVELNGRQIKNVLKSAALLSARKKEGLSRKYVDMVLAIEKKRPAVSKGF